MSTGWFVMGRDWDVMGVFAVLVGSDALGHHVPGLLASSALVGDRVFDCVACALVMLDLAG